MRETNADLRTAIPPSTRLLKAAPKNDVVTIDVTPNLAALSGSTLVDAIGQIVLTATGVTGVTGVLITIGDEPHPWPLPDGSTSTEPLERSDYESLLPAHNTPVTDPVPVTDVVDHHGRGDARAGDDHDDHHHRSAATDRGADGRADRTSTGHRGAAGHRGPRRRRAQLSGRRTARPRYDASRRDRHE